MRESGICGKIASGPSRGRCGKCRLEFGRYRSRRLGLGAGPGGGIFLLPQNMALVLVDVVDRDGRSGGCTCLHPAERSLTRSDPCSRRLKVFTVPTCSTLLIKMGEKYIIFCEYFLRSTTFPRRMRCNRRASLPRIAKSYTLSQYHNKKVLHHLAGSLCVFKASFPPSSAIKRTLTGK